MTPKRAQDAIDHSDDVAFINDSKKEVTTKLQAFKDLVAYT